jgi:hypothetical protein
MRNYKLPFAGLFWSTLKQTEKSHWAFWKIDDARWISTGYNGEKQHLRNFSQLGHLLPELSPCAQYPTICCDFEILVIVSTPPPKKKN